MTYALFVGLGILAGVLVARRAGPLDGVPTPPFVRMAALVGAVVGAFAFELPADLLGWAPEVTDVPSGRVLGGRTVLGGLLGGWVAVEWAKWRVGHTAPTGDSFALGLPVSLGIARLGCVFTGCCPGCVIDPSDPWARVSLALHDEPRFPATLVEAYFHIGSAAVVFVLTRRGLVSGLRLLGYFAAYGAFRFVIEFYRDVPRPFGGLSYYQLLALALGGAALVATVRRARQPSFGSRARASE
ncbi:MAG: prolipoprotein diacylglyceryl transferase [Deltaproteobacteria bacterium]|nr:prolipoprotein diacylglyceryl transferase [Deltaproteobacteria bacterium]